MSEVTILVTTWLPPECERERLDALVECLYSWNRLRGAKLNIHIQDDGTDNDWFDILKKEVQDISGYEKAKFSFSQQNRQGLGASLNNGLKIAFERSPLVLHAVDDWELLANLDLSPWVNFIEDHNYNVDMVRFFPHPDLTGIIKHIPPHGWAMNLDLHHYVFGLRPCLWHKSLFDKTGYFKENVSAIESEQEFNQRIVFSNRPSNIWLALTEMWRPIDTISLSELVP